MPTNLTELLLLVSAPLIALLMLVVWVSMSMKATKVVNIKLNFLGLSLTARSCPASESEYTALRRKLMLKPESQKAPKVRAKASDSLPPSRGVKKLLKEPSTWAGIFAIAGAFATSGVSALTDPTLLSTIGSGLALVLTKEAE